MRQIKIAACQIEPLLGDKQANLKKIRSFVEAAAREGAQLVCFPEMCYTGYDLTREELKELAEPVDGQFFAALSELARTFKIEIIAGYPERSLIDGCLFISVMCVDFQGILVANHRKICLWKQEKHLVRLGTDIITAHTSVGRIAPLICYEMEYPEISRLACLRGAQLLTFSSAYQGVHLMERYLRANALQNLVPVVGVNMVGYGKNGHSMILDATGEVLACASDNHEEMVIAEVDLESDVRERFPHWHDLNPQWFSECMKCSQVQLQ